MNNKEGFNPECNYLEELAIEARKTLIDYREKLKNNEKNDLLFEVKDEILSNMMGIMEFSGNPKPISEDNKLFNGQKNWIYFYSRSNNAKRIDILDYEKGGFLGWEVVVLNEKTSKYESTVLIVNPQLIFIRSNVIYENMTYEEQRNQVMNFLKKNEGEPIKSDLDNYQMPSYKIIDKTISRKEVLGTFVFDYPL